MDKIKIYKTDGYKEHIEEILADKVTDKTVWLKNGRSAKRSLYANYWDTKEEAKTYLTNKLTRNIKILENNLIKAINNLEELKKY